MADWTTTEKESGEAWLAGQSDINAGSTVVSSGQIVYAGQLGTATSWSLEAES